MVNPLCLRCPQKRKCWWGLRNFYPDSHVRREFHFKLDLVPHSICGDLWLSIKFWDSFSSYIVHMKISYQDKDPTVTKNPWDLPQSDIQYWWQGISTFNSGKGSYTFNKTTVKHNKIIFKQKEGMCGTCWY